MTANDNNDRAFELYRALSDVDGRFVEEMLDDGIAEDIRAENRRRRITLRSSLTAAAAVFLLVIGIGVLPALNKGITKDYTARKSADTNGTLFGKPDKSFSSTVGPAEEAAEDTDGLTMDEKAGEADDGGDYEDEMTENIAPEAEDAERGADKDEKGYAEAPRQPENCFYELLELEDGGMVTVLEAELDGDAAEAQLEDMTAEGVVICSIKGVSSNNCVAVFYPDEQLYRVALCGNYAPEYLTEETTAKILEKYKLSDLVKLR